MAVYLLDSLENLPILSFEGRYVEKNPHIEKFCKKCKKKFFKDTKPNFFGNIDKYGIKEAVKGGIFNHLCTDCSINFIEDNTRLDSFF